MNLKTNSKINLDKISISMDETYHLYDGNPLYDKKFKSVMSFHSPGVAAVMDELDSYHIDLNGEPIYRKRFLKAFGYYENNAAVMDDSGWYHINLRGESLYERRFKWVGNFQENSLIPLDFHLIVKSLKSG